MTSGILYNIKKIIRYYFETGKADKLRNEGFEEIKNLIWRRGGFWKDYKPYLNKIITQTQTELQMEFESGHLKNIDDVIKKQLYDIITLTDNKLENKAKKAQRIIADALEKSFSEGKKWEDYARRAFDKIKLEDRHVKTEIETAKAALNNLKRYRNFTEGKTEDIFYRYEGPDTERPFCKEHINRIYSLDEISRMKNHFSQPAFAYAGGYNCRHRWVPVIGDRNGNLFVEQSWQKQFENASKNEKEAMRRELDFAKKASTSGIKTELNYGLKSKHGKDTDFIFDGKYAQLKQPVTTNINSLGRLPRGNQADLVIIELNFNPDANKMERLNGKFEKWINEHKNKQVILYYNNEPLRIYK